VRFDEGAAVGATDAGALPFPLAPGAARYFGRDGTYAVASDDVDGERLLLPVVLRRRGPFRLLRCLFAPVGADGSVPTAEAEAAFAERFVEHVRRERVCDRIGQPENWALFRHAPAGSTSAPFGSYRVALEGRTIEEVVAGFKSRFRNYVRAGAAAAGTALREGPEALDAFYGLHAATMERAGMWLPPRSLFDDLVASFGPVADVVVLEVDGVPAVGEIVMTTRFGSFGLYTGTSRAAPNYAGKYLKAEMMRRSIDRGAPFFDFVGARLSDVGGTSLEGIQQFKAAFGAELVEGVLWKADIASLRCRTLDVVQRLRGGASRDIIDQELQRA
jgi:hypothetical protein